MNAFARPIPLLVALVAAGSLLSSFGCEVAKTGEEGNLKFSYTADDRLIPPTFNRPVATGMRVEVQVTDADTNEAVTIVSANSDRPSVLTVPQKSGSRLTIAGEGAGEAKIAVTVTGSVSDTIAVNVADIDEVVLRNPGPLLTPVVGTPAVITNADVPFGMTLVLVRILAVGFCPSIQMYCALILLTVFHSW